MSSRTYAMKGLAIAALSAVVLAACESKSTTIPPASIAVTVTPASITLAVGQTGAFVATVTGGDQSTARTVTWSSSNSSVATVDANGNVTAVANGQASIIATSTADPNAKGAGNVTVSGGATGTASITIQSITNQAGQPVDVTNTKGQINVNLNVGIPAGAQVSSAQVLLDGTQVCQQTFSSTTSAEASADVLTITCPIPTQAYDTTTGAVTWMNGPHTLSAALIGASGNTAAQVSQSLIFNNTNFLKVTPMFSGGTANSGSSALAPAGSAWGAGDLTFNVLPVTYSGTGSSIASVSISITTAATGVTGATGCVTNGDASSDPTIAPADRTPAGVGATPSCAAKSATLTDADASDGLSVTFPAANAIDKAGAPGVKGMEDVLATVVVNSVTSGGQSGPVCINPDPTTNPQNAGCGNGLAAGQVRVDNLAPRVTSFATANANGYVNADYSFDDNIKTVDYGVDSQNDTFMAGTSASSLSAVSTGADLAESATNHDYLLQLTTTDALGNARTVFGTDVVTCVSTSATTVPACGSAIATFGVDKTTPTIAYDASSVKDKATFTTVSPLGQVFAVMFSDTAVPPAAPSGFAAMPIYQHIYQYLPAGSTCIVGGTSCAFKATTASPPLYSEPVDGGAAAEGYYTFTAYVEDAAGNASDTVATRTVLIDATAPVAGGIVAPSTINGGGTVTFTQSVSDNIDLGTSTPSILYGDTTLAGFVLGFPATTLGTFGYDAFTTAMTASVPVANFISSIEQTDGTDAPSGLGTPADHVITTTTDVAGNATTVAQDISANLGTPGWFSDGTGAVAPNTFALTSSNASVCNDSDANGCAAASKTSTTLQASAVGATATFANPFAAVRFYYATATNPKRLVLIGSGTVGVVDTGVRTWTYTLANWAPPSSLAPQNITVYAVGVDSKGRALITQPVTVGITAD